MRRRTTERDAFRNDEELVGFARSYLSDAFPNPERTGCPGDGALRLMATQPLESHGSISEHLMWCSPCFRAYMRHLAKARAKVRKTTWIKRSAAACGVAAVLAIVGFLFLAKHGNRVTVAPQNEASTVAPRKPDQTQASATYVPVSIDLRSASPTRGSEQRAVRSVPQAIPTGCCVALRLLLPLGSEEGLYLVTLISRGRVVWSASSQARQENDDIVLQIHADFKDISPGSYKLQVSSGAARLSVPVLIETAPPTTPNNDIK